MGVVEGAVIAASAAAASSAGQTGLQLLQARRDNAAIDSNIRFENETLAVNARRLRDNTQEERSDAERARNAALGRLRTLASALGTVRPSPGEMAELASAAARADSRIIDRNRYTLSDLATSAGRRVAALGEQRRNLGVIALGGGLQTLTSGAQGAFAGANAGGAFPRESGLFRSI